MQLPLNQIIQGDCLKVLKSLPSESVNCCITSPPYWGLRDYGSDGQLGLEETPEHYVENMKDVFVEVRRVLRKEGTLWLNIGDSYANSGQQGPQKNLKKLSDKMAPRKNPRKKNCDADGLIKRALKRIPPGVKAKDLIGVPWRLAFALQADGWYLRQDIIWHKPNPMPESVKDRCTKAHEYIFLFSRSTKYYYDYEAIKEPGVKDPSQNKSYHKPGYNKMVPDERWNDQFDGRIWGEDGLRNKRSVWTVTTKPFKGAHFATFPPDLIEPCIKAGCPKGGIVLDPFMGSGTTAMVSKALEKNYVGIELNQEYIDIAKKRLKKGIQKRFI